MITMCWRLGMVVKSINMFNIASDISNLRLQMKDEENEKKRMRQLKRSLHYCHIIPKSYCLHTTSLSSAAFQRQMFYFIRRFLVLFEFILEENIQKCACLMQWCIHADISTLNRNLVIDQIEPIEFANWLKLANCRAQCSVTITTVSSLCLHVWIMKSFKHRFITLLFRSNILSLFRQS